MLMMQWMMMVIPNMLMPCSFHTGVAFGLLLSIMVELFACCQWLVQVETGNTTQAPAVVERNLLL